MCVCVCVSVRETGLGEAVPISHATLFLCSGFQPLDQPSPHYCCPWKKKWKSLSCVQLFVTSWTVQSMEFSRLVYWSSFLQGIFPTQELNPGLPHFRRILYWMSHQGSPRILAWVACSFSSGSSYPGIEPGSPALQADLYQLSYQRSPYISVYPINHSGICILCSHLSSPSLYILLSH